MRRSLLAVLSLALACATAPPVDADHGALWGYVKLVPKAGAGGAGDAYADRRVRAAAHFDYSHPSFAVVYAPSTPVSAAPPVALSLENGRDGAAWSPPHAAVVIGGKLAIANHTQRPQVVSAPAEGWLRELAPGESAALRAERSGELEIHALRAASTPALVFVTPGVYAIADSAGRYELRGLAPGDAEIRAWHPRLPPSAAHTVRVRPGEAQRLDLELGVDRGEGSHP